jgi:hypothetical protein
MICLSSCSTHLRVTPLTPAPPLTTGASVAPLVPSHGACEEHGLGLGVWLVLGLVRRLLRCYWCRLRRGGAAVAGAGLDELRAELAAARAVCARSHSPSWQTAGSGISSPVRWQLLLPGVGAEADGTEAVRVPATTAYMP